MRILVFGDSITYGAWDSQGGWVDRLKRWAHQQYLANGTKLQVINLGVGGDTSRKIRTRMEAEITARHSPNWPFVIILMLGTNDGRTREGIIDVPKDEFADNYRAIVRIAKSFTDRIIIVGLPPLGESELDFKDMRYNDETVQGYETGIRNIAAEENLLFIDVRPLFTDATFFCPDKLHPNDKGHAIIYEAVRDKLVKLLV